MERSRRSPDFYMTPDDGIELCAVINIQDINKQDSMSVLCIFSTAISDVNLNKRRAACEIQNSNKVYLTDQYRTDLR